MEAVTYKGLKQIDLLKIALWPINLLNSEFYSIIIETKMVLFIVF